MGTNITDVYQDYKSIENDLENYNTKADVIYETIMQKEDARLNLLNRIIDHKQREDNIDTLFKMSIEKIIKQTITIWWQVYIDIVSRGVYDPRQLFWRGERKIYTGIFFVIIAIVLFFVNISE